MMLTIDQLVTLERALNCYAVSHVRAAAYHSHACKLDYALSGGDGKPVEKAQELLKIVGDEIERLKGAV